jgi:hypothetical protein
MPFCCKVRGVVFWLLGAYAPYNLFFENYAPYILKYIFDIFQNVNKFEKKNHTYIFRCYMPTKSFHDRSTCREAY